MPANLHCPFCGSKYHSVVVHDIRKKYVSVKCNVCEANGPLAFRHSKTDEKIDTHDIQRAYTNWNMRSEEIDEEDFDSDYDGGYREDDWGDR